MQQQGSGHEIARKKVVLDLHGTEAVVIRAGVPYGSTAEEVLLLDAYYPAECGATPLPAVLLTTGFPDAGMRRAVGCAAKDMAAFTSWSRLIAASGMVAITYTNADPVRDASRVLRFLRDRCVELGVDAGRIGLWSCSGHASNAVSLLVTARPAPACAAFFCPLFGDPQGLDGLPPDLPLFVARAGRDEIPGLNTALDTFVAGALRRNQSLTFVNHQRAPHAFDITDDGDELSMEIIRRALSFLRFHLGVRLGRGQRPRGRE